MIRFVAENSLLRTLVDFFFTWDNNSMLQTYIDDLLEEILNTEDHSDLCEQLIVLLKLPQKIMEAYDLFSPPHLVDDPSLHSVNCERAQAAFAAASIRNCSSTQCVGYFGHLACFADYISHCEDAKELLQDIDGWDSFTNRTLETVYSVRKVKWAPPTRQGKVKLVAD